MLPFPLMVHRLELPFLALSLGLCLGSAWLVRRRPLRLIPAWAQRLVFLFLAFQIILILVNVPLVMTGTELFPFDLWYLDTERGFSSVSSTLLLLLLAILCLFTGLTRGQVSRPERVYWLALGSGITLMALMEFNEILSKYLLPRAWYVPTGVLVVAATLSLFLRHGDDRRRACLLFLLAGLGVWAFAAVVVDSTTDTEAYLSLEETLETLGILAALAAVAGYAATVAPPVRAQRVVTRAGSILIFPFLAILLAWHQPAYETLLRGSLPARFAALSKNYEYLLSEPLFASRVEVVINDALALTSWLYALPEPGAAAKMSLWLHAVRQIRFPDRFGIALQLLDQESGAVIAEAERPVWDGRYSNQWSPGRLNTRVEELELALPATAPTNRAWWLTLSFWRWDGLQALYPLPVSAGDQTLLGDSHIVLDEFLLPRVAASADPGAARGRFANGFVLQQVDLPAQARAGSEVEVTFNWRADSAGSEDWIQFLHFVHEESGALWNIDRQPLGPRLPTRLWYAGMRASETWRFPLPADLQPGRHAVYSGLYRLADMQRLDLTLADGTQPADAGIPLGSLLIER